MAGAFWGARRKLEEGAWGDFGLCRRLPAGGLSRDRRAGSVVLDRARLVAVRSRCSNRERRPRSADAKPASRAPGDARSHRQDERPGGTPSFVIRQGGYLTGPSTAKPRAIALDYLSDHSELFRLSRADLASFDVAAKYVTARSGATQLTLQQLDQGRRVEGALLTFVIDGRGRVASVGGASYPGAAANPTYSLSAARAVGVAASALGLEDRQLRLISFLSGPARLTVFRNMLSGGCTDQLRSRPSSSRSLSVARKLASVGRRPSSRSVVSTRRSSMPTPGTCCTGTASRTSPGLRGTSTPHRTRRRPTASRSSRSRRAGSRPHDVREQRQLLPGSQRVERSRLSAADPGHGRPGLPALRLRVHRRLPVERRHQHHDRPRRDPDPALLLGEQGARLLLLAPNRRAFAQLPERQLRQGWCGR